MYQLKTQNKSKVITYTKPNKSRKYILLKLTIIITTTIISRVNNPDND